MSNEHEIPVTRAEIPHDPDWVCSKCGKTPRVMHDEKARICVECYENSKPGPVPTYVSGDRVETPNGPGSVNWMHVGTNDRDSVVNVIVDSLADTRPHYQGSTFLAELVKPLSNKRRR